MPWFRRIRPVLVMATVLWVLSASAGLSLLWGYENTPGVSAKAPPQWPTDSGIQRDPNRATLIMLVHPQCPCSRASIGELAEVMAQSPGRLIAFVLFLKPAGVPSDWEKSDLWKSAAKIPGVTVLVDNNGTEASRFNAATSGQTMLYDAGGYLLFRGGITDARGHAGENAGSSSIIALVNESSADRTETSVFGCPLFDPNTDCRIPAHPTNPPRAGR
jgi:hypothetical protein